MMTATQLEFFRALCRPFAPNETSTKPGGGGRKLTWIDKRALENRLDSIAGPDGWKPKYTPTSRGYTCTLWILIPQRDGTWGWLDKDDGAGFEEMGATNKQTGEFECEVDNDEKSGYTNALRRAAQDAWGIGRDLYQKGSPTWMNGDPTPSTPRSSAPPAAQPPRTQETGRGNGETKFDNFKIPRAGRAVFAWAKNMEATFQTSLLNGLVAKCHSITGSNQLDEMNQDQANEACMDVIGFIKTLDNYGGQFDNLTVPSESLPDFGPAPKGPPPAKDLYRLKKQVLDNAQKLIFILTGSAGTQEELVSEIQVYSKAALGREIGSLKACVSEADLAGLVDYLQMRIVRAQEDAKATVDSKGEDDIPF